VLIIIKMVDCGDVMGKFDILIAVFMEIQVLWDLTSVSVGKYLPMFLRSQIGLLGS
jgi:hypothetical protein